MRARRATRLSLVSFVALQAAIAQPSGCTCEEPLTETVCAFTVEPSGANQIIDFGEVAVGSERARTLRITNTGTVGLTEFTFEFSERNATHYRVVTAEDFRVDINTNETVSVVFAPLAESTNLGSSFTVAHPAVGGAACSAFNVVVDGDGYAPLVEPDGGVPDGGDGDGDAGVDAGEDGGAADGGDGDGDGGTFVDAGVVTPPDSGVLLDPNAEWESKGALAEGRGGFALVRLPDDTLVVVGGHGPGGESLDTIERFDPVTNVSTVVGHMRVPRVFPGAAVLASGRVLIVGGASSLVDGVLLTTVEVFDPSEADPTASVECVQGQGTCDLDDVTGGLGLVDVPRLAPLVVASPVSERALVVFGRYDVELDGDLAPEQGHIDLTGTPNEVADFQVEARVGGAAATLPNGQVVVAGGRNQAGALLDDVLLVDGESGDISTLGVTITPRAFGGAAALSTGDVVVVGGFTTGGAPATQIERIVDVTGAPSTSNLATPVLPVRLSPTVAALSGDLVLVAGGAPSLPTDVDDAVVPLASADVLVPLPGGNFVRLSPSNALATPRFDHQSAVSTTGERVWFVGGIATVPRRAGLHAIERYDLVENAFGGAGILGLGTALEAAAWPPSGGLLSSGGTDPHTGAITTRNVVYDVETDLYTELAPLGSARRDHTITRLADGVAYLVAGGRDASGQVLTSASLYIAVAPDFDEPLPVTLVRARAEHTATLLDDGRVLLCGGKGTLGEPLDTCEVFTPPVDVQNPATYGTASFELTLGRMSAGRYAHSATLLETGEVLLIGGGDVEQDLVPADLFDPGETRVDETGAPAFARRAHAAVFLGSGRVLVVGGETGIGGLGPTATVEVYERANEVFVPAGELVTARVAPAAFRLLDGQVLVVGGTTNGGGSSSVSLANAELYTPDAFGVGTFENIDIPLDAARSAVVGVDVYGRAVVASGHRKDGALANGAEHRTPLFFVERLMNPDD